MAVIFSLFAVQLLRIQGVDSASVSEQALGGRLQRVTIPAQRGEVVDANGATLASSVERRHVTADPVAMSTYTKKTGKKPEKVGLEGAARDLAPLLGVDRRELLAQLRKGQSKKSRFLYLAKNVAPSQWRGVQDLRVPGVFSERVVRREYPQGTSVAPMVGWVNQNGDPGGGIEQMMDSRLQGKPGVHVFERAPNGSIIATGDNKDTPAAPGTSVQLTVDNDLQWFAQNTIAQRVKDAKALSGDAVVMNARTGEILAAASYPSFDPTSIGAKPGYLQLRPFNEVYEPGSTSKVITMAAAMERGYTTPTSKVVVPPELRRAGRPFHDAHEHPTLNLTTAGVLAQSSNIGTIQIGEKMPPSLLRDYMSRFGLGSHTGMGFPGESRGLLPKTSQWTGDRRYTVMFGQGMASTTVQQASVFQTIANGGVRQPIKIVKGIGDGKGGYTAPQDDRRAARVIKPQTATSLTRMLQSVVDGEEGTAKQAAVPGYTVAGKTSTAQRWDSSKGRYDGTTASFIGYAPAQNPEIVVAVTIQKPRTGTYGGTVAAPAFAKIMGFALQQRGIPPIKGGLPTYPQTTDHPATEQKKP